MEIKTVEQALQRAAILVLATMNDNEEMFNANLSDDPIEARAILLSLAGIASHLAWNLEKADRQFCANDQVGIALGQAVRDYRDYEREDAGMN